MKYFTIDELCSSMTARAKGIDNTPTLQVKQNLIALINNTLDPIRELHGAGIRVNSGYRSPELNAIVGGAYNSQHMTGQAADITTGSKEGNVRLFAQIVASGIPYDQLIDEKGYSWIHVSFNDGLNGSKNRYQIRHL